MSKEQPENKTLAVTSVGEIKDRAKKTIHEGTVVELPSGICVKLARPSLGTMIKEGIIPANLVQTALRQISGTSAISISQVKDSIKVTEFIVIQAIKEPKVVLKDPADGQLEISDFTDEDRGFIFNYVQTGAMDLEPFRSEQSSRTSGSNLQKVSGDKAE